METPRLVRGVFFGRSIGECFDQEILFSLPGGWRDAINAAENSWPMTVRGAKKRSFADGITRDRNDWHGQIKSLVGPVHFDAARPAGDR
jgi:hypothetical protein